MACKVCFVGLVGASYALQQSQPVGTLFAAAAAGMQSCQARAIWLMKACCIHEPGIAQFSQEKYAMLPY